MDYRVDMAGRMLANKRGSMLGAILAVSIGILVIHVNFVIFQGLFDAIVRDMTEYRFGDIYVTDEESFIEKSDTALIGWFERIPDVRAAAPRLSSSASVNASVYGERIEEFRIPVVGVDPYMDVQASTAYRTVKQGEYVFARNSIVVGSTVSSDLGGVTVGDIIELKVTDRWGIDQTRHFVISGIATSPGGNGFDNSIVVHIDTLRSMLDRHGETGSILVRLEEPDRAGEIRDLFLASFPGEDFRAETISESAEETLSGFRSGIAMINMIGLFGMMSSAFAIVTIQIMLVSSKTREIGIMRAIGARRRDILVLFIIQGMMIGLIGAASGTAMGLAYTAYAKETKMSFSGSLELEVTYAWDKIVQTALTAFALAVAASIYPSFRATRLQPVEAMRTV